MPKDFFFTVMFCNKGMEQINLNRFLGSEGAITRLSGKHSSKKIFRWLHIGLHK